MTQINDEFGTLRSLLQQKPSSKTFSDILRYLVQHREHDAFDEVWLPYTRDNLKPWSDISRSLYKPEDFELLEKHDGVTGLIRGLSFRHMGFRSAQTKKIIHNPVLADITELTLPNLDYQLEEGLRTFFEDTPLRRLKALRSGHNPGLKEAGIKTMLEYLAQPDLESLEVGNCGIGARALKTLLKHPDILRLRHLNLDLNRLGPGGARAIEKATGLTQLERLDLFGTTGSGRIKAAGTQALARSPHLKTLKSLDLRNQDIQDEGLIAIAESLYLTKLERLTVTENRLSEQSILALCHSPNATHIQRLLLGRNYSVNGNAVVEGLVSSSTLGSLTSLGISEMEITDDAFIKLIESPLAQQFVNLYAPNNALTNRSADALIAAKLPNLEGATIGGSKMDRQHMDRVKQRYKNIIMV